jgi:sulfonate transport system substrate-binding protein
MKSPTDMAIGGPMSRRALLTGAGATLAGATALLLPGASIGAAADAAPQQLTVAVIGDGRTGVWASLRAGVGGRNLEQELSTKIV